MLALASGRPYHLTPPAQQRHSLAAVGRGRRRRLGSSRPLASQAPSAQQQQQQLDESSASRESSGGGRCSSPAKRGRGKPSSTAEQQPQLQAWLQQEQGLSAQAADQQARRLAIVFGSQQAALDGLPATFEWCRSQGLTGLQAAQLLDSIAKYRRDNVVQFASLVQPVWQLLDSHIAAHVEPLQQAGARLPKHTRLAGVLCSSAEAAQALVMPSGHVEAWLAAVGERLPAAAISRLLLTNPVVVKGSPSTALAAISWAADVLCVTDPAAFFAGAAGLLNCGVSALQRNLDSLQQGLGCTVEQAQQLAVKQPVVLASSPDTVQAALDWLRQLFPDAAQLADVVERAPQLLCCPVQRLQGNADTLQQALGWQDGDGQLAALVAARPQPFACVSLSGEDAQYKLRLLSEVVGVSRQECLTSGLSYLNRRLESMAARYMLVQGRAPELLRNKAGELQLSWIVNANQARSLSRLGMTRPEFNTFVREWRRSEEGRRLLEGLRAGSVEGWPRPPALGEAEQRRREEAQQRRQAGAARRTGTAAAMDGKRQGRGRRSKAQDGGGGADGGSDGVER